jgi:hypothetical protein
MNTTNSNNTNKNNTSMNMDTTTGHGNNNSMEMEVVGAVTTSNPGTHAADVLKNKVIPLRTDYIGIVNRG